MAIAAGARARVFGVEVEASCPFTRSLPAGRIVRIEVGDTIADGLAGNLNPETITFDLVRRHAAGIVTVTEAEIRGAIAALWKEEGLTAEGAAATAIAAVMTGRIDLRGRRAAVVLTGANMIPRSSGKSSEFGASVNDSRLSKRHTGGRELQEITGGF